MALGARIKQERVQASLEQGDVVARVNEQLPEGLKKLSQQALSNLETRDSKTNHRLAFRGKSLRF